MDVRGDAERVVLAYGVNDHGTFMPARAAENYNVGADYGAPIGAPDVDLVYLIEAVIVWSGPVGAVIVWRNDPNGTPRASEGICEGRSRVRASRNDEVVDIRPDRREGERSKDARSRSQLDRVVDGAIANSILVTEYRVRYVELHPLFFSNLVINETQDDSVQTLFLSCAITRGGLMSPAIPSDHPGTAVQIHGVWTEQLEFDERGDVRCAPLTIGRRWKGISERVKHWRTGQAVIATKTWIIDSLLRFIKPHVYNHRGAPDIKIHPTKR